MILSGVSVLAPVAVYQYGLMSLLLYYTTTENWSRFNKVQQQLDADGAAVDVGSEGKAMNAGEVMEEIVAIFLILVVDYVSQLVSLFVLSVGNVLIKLPGSKTDRLSEQKNLIKLGSFLLSTLFGAIALYLTFQCKPEFGIDDQDESW